MMVIIHFANPAVAIEGLSAGRKPKYCQFAGDAQALFYYCPSVLGWNMLQNIRCNHCVERLIIERQPRCIRNDWRHWGLWLDGEDYVTPNKWKLVKLSKPHRTGTDFQQRITAIQMLFEHSYDWEIAGGPIQHLEQFS